VLTTPNITTGAYRDADRAAAQSTEIRGRWLSTCSPPEGTPSMNSVSSLNVPCCEHVRAVIHLKCVRMLHDCSTHVSILFACSQELPETLLTNHRYTKFINPFRPPAVSSVYKNIQVHYAFCGLQMYFPCINFLSMLHPY
jgi:hypothetical protein